MPEREIPMYEFGEDGSLRDEHGTPTDLSLILAGMDPSRPEAIFNRQRDYGGQMHTDQGERGRTLVEGLTFRDVVDCFYIGCYLASGLPREQWPGSAYELPWHDMDIVAVQQNMSCEMERRMGIFPNVPRLSWEGRDA